MIGASAKAPRGLLPPSDISSIEARKAHNIVDHEDALLRLGTRYGQNSSSVSVLGDQPCARCPMSG